MYLKNESQNSANQIAAEKIIFTDDKPERNVILRVFILQRVLQRHKAKIIRGM